MEKKEDSAWYSTWFDSPFYHILYKHRNYQEAEQAVLNIIKHLKIEKGDSIMDLCCGKGRHSVVLEREGAVVTGLDLSPANIAACNESSNANLQFEIHDMREPYLKKKFDYVLNLFTSFGYFGDEENEQSLQAIHQSLLPSGKLLIDFLNVIPVLKELPVQETIIIDDIEFNITKHLHQGKIIKDIQFDFEHKKYHFTEEVNALQLSDFTRYFENTGFRIVAIMGDYDWSAFDEHQSKRLILLTERI
jgi:SAM-dependent methyltransferase